MSEFKPRCPVARCDRRLGVGMCMCRRHWRTVPHEARREFWDAWAAWRSGEEAADQMRAAWWRCIELVETGAA